VRETQIVETENKMTDPPKSFVLENKIKKEKDWTKSDQTKPPKSFVLENKIKEEKDLTKSD